MVKLNKLDTVKVESKVGGAVSVEPGKVDALLSPSTKPIYEYGTDINYVTGDYALVKVDKQYVIYKANKDTSGVFDPTAWEKYSLAGSLESQFAGVNDKIQLVDDKVDEIREDVDGRISTIESSIAEMTDSVFQDDEGLSKITALPQITCVLDTSKFNPFVSLYERGIEKFKGLSLNGLTIPMDTNQYIDLGPAPTSGVGYNLVFAEIYKVMTSVGVRTKYRLRSVLLTEDEQILSKDKSRFLVAKTLGQASTKIVPFNTAGEPITTDDGVDENSTAFQLGSYLSITERTATENENQKVRLYDTDLYVAGNGTKEAKLALGTVDGFSYAIPLYYIKRRNSFPYSIFNKDGGSFYREGEVTLNDTNLKAHSVFSLSMGEESMATLKSGDVFFLGAIENDTKIQYSGFKDTYNRPYFTFIDQFEDVKLDSKDQIIYSYSKDGHYYNIIDKDDVELVIKTEFDNSSYEELLENEFNKLLRGDLKLSSREIVEYFGPASYDEEGNLNKHIINANERYINSWGNRPAYVEVTRTIYPDPALNPSDIELNTTFRNAFTKGDTIKINSDKIISPPLNEALKMGAAVVSSVSGNTVTVDNVKDLSVGDIVNVVNSKTLEIVGRNISITEVNETLSTLKLSDVTNVAEKYFILESSVTPYFIASTSQVQASWVDINTRNPLMKLLTPELSSTMLNTDPQVNNPELLDLEFYSELLNEEGTLEGIQVACGSNHTVALKKDGTLWAWGNNGYGQLGDGATDSKVPKQIGTDTTWSSIACGLYHTSALKKDGTLWAWGYNAFGQLGDGTTTNSKVPKQIGTDTTWSSIACGDNHTVALKKDGTSWAWGRNGAGQLGDGTTTNSLVPKQIGTDTTWSSIACGSNHTVALKKDGTLWAWGRNDKGQLGDGTTTQRTSPVQIGTDTTWSSIACGSNHTVALKKDGTLWAWGHNDKGQLGDDTTTQRTSPVQIGTDTTWSSIACGSNHTVALKKDGTLWAWGSNGNGQLGDGTTTQRTSPVQIGNDNTWSSIACGNGHTVALKKDGTLWAWGFNGDGRLGDGTTTDSSIPVKALITFDVASNAKVLSGANIYSSISNNFSFIIKKDGTLWAWGRNNYGQLGDGTTTDSTVPKQIGTDTTWSSIACGDNHTVALKKDGTSWAWGYNAFGQLGDGTTTNGKVPKQIGTDTTWSSIACGDNHTVALKKDGTSWAWGSNGAGQLGDGTTTNSLVPKQIGTDTTWSSIACGSNHTVALKKDGTLWAWGRNDKGQLGDGTTTDSKVPKQIGTDKWISVSAGVLHTMGVNAEGILWGWGSMNSCRMGINPSADGYAIPNPLALSPMKVGTDTTWSSVACGGSHTVALKKDDTLWTWGLNNYGQLGDGTTNVSVPKQIGTDTTWSSIACGYSHTVALKKDGTLWAWGLNDYGQLGDGTTTDRLVPTLSTLEPDLIYSTVSSAPVYVPEYVDETVYSNFEKIVSGAYHTVALKKDGTLWAWGSNTSGQLGDGTTTQSLVPKQIGTDTTWSSIACGDNHTVALKKDGTSWAWGSNGAGQLGDGTTTNSLVPKQIGTDTTWSSIACGSNHTVALKKDGTLWAWGRNDKGQLGDGTTTDSKVPKQIGTDKWISVSAGVLHTMGVNAEGILWGWGSMNSCRMGINPSADGYAIPNPLALSPMKVGTDTTWSSVACGGSHTVALKKDDTLWTWGLNNYGQLGDGTTNVSVPKQIGTDTTWSSIACGYSHTVALKKDGTLWAWGHNNSGQLGDGTSTQSTVPKQIGTDTTWSSISCGDSHTVAIKKDGTLWAWGHNNNGQLGDGTNTQRNSPVKIDVEILTFTFRKFQGSLKPQISVGEKSAFVLKDDGVVYAAGAGNQYQLGNGSTNNLTDFTEVLSKDESIKIASGPSCSLGIKRNGTIWAWGTNTGTFANGLDTGTFTNPVQVTDSGEWRDVYVASNFGFAIKYDNTLWAFGSDNTSGQLGIDTSTGAQLKMVKIGDDYKDLRVGGTFVYGFKLDGSIYKWGSNILGQMGQSTGSSINKPTKFAEPDEWRDIQVGYGHIIGIKQDGTLWAWGGNSYGQIGDGTKVQVMTPKQIGTDTDWSTIYTGMFTSFAKKSNNDFYAWGKNTEGQLGDGTVENKLVPTKVTHPNWTMFSGGDKFSVGVTKEGYVYTMGVSDMNVSTTFDKTPKLHNVSAKGPELQIACGANHTIALKKDGTLWSWGYNSYGQLGDGTTTNSLVPKQISTDTTWSSITCGANHTVALKKDGTLWAWGNNVEGQLGDGTTTKSLVPKQIGTDTTWSSITCGNYHSVALKKDGTLWAWGHNDYGQLGDGTTTNILVPKQIGTDTTWSYITCGNYHSVALKKDGTLWAWGNNGYGQLGDGTTTNSNVPKQIGTDTTWSSIACGNSYTLALKKDGTLWAWGYNLYGQLGDGTTTNSKVPKQIGTDTTWSSISCGGYHTVALKKDGTLWSWGNNVYGQLGDGTTTKSLVPKQIGTDTTWSSIACGNNHTLALKKDGTLWAWGRNGNGQLGDGTITDSKVPKQTIYPSDKTNNTYNSVFPIDLGYIIYNPVTKETYVNTESSKPVFHNSVTKMKNIKLPNIEAPKVVRSNKTDVVIIDGYGYLYGTGKNANGILGLGNDNTQYGITQLSLDRIKDVALGKSHMILVKEDGTLWTSGDNTNGQLGDGTTTSSTTLKQVGSDTDWSLVAATENGSVAVKTDGTVYQWGLVQDKTYGASENVVIKTPTKLDVLGEVKAIEAGLSHVVALTNETVNVWGHNNKGQLGLGHTDSVFEPTMIDLRNIGEITKIAAGDEFTLIMNNEFRVFGTGDNQYEQLNLGVNLSTTDTVTSFKLIENDKTNNRTIRASGNTVMITFETGQATKVFGEINDVILGKTNKIKQLVSTTFDTYFVLLDDGTLWSWGYNGSGQLGDGTTTNSTVPKQIGTDTTWSSITCGNYHSVALKKDGTLWAWGHNDYGQLGDGTTTNILVPKQIGTDTTWSYITCGNYHSVALKKDGTLWAWGHNDYGQLGDGTTTNSKVPKQIGTDTTWSSISCGGYHTVALKKDGTLWAWGNNGYGQLGDGTTTNSKVPKQIGTDTTWSSIACGQFHTVAIKKDGTLWAWALNKYGQLGDGTITDSLVPKQIGTDTTWSYISCGNYHTVALKKDDTLWAWGRNGNGQLGDGTITDSKVPKQIGTEKYTEFYSLSNSTVMVNDSVSIVGLTIIYKEDVLTNSPVKVIIDSNVIACGQYHTVALKKDGTLWAWGYNDYGRLGDGTTTDSLVPKQIGTDTTWSSIACGANFTVAIKEDGTLWSWGYNAYGQLGDDTTTDSSVPKQIGSDNTWSSISCGANHTVAIKEDGTLWSWGNNGYGRLGDGTTTNSSVPKQIGTDTTWSSISCGSYHTLALKKDGTLWAWGSNAYGQLGDDTTTDSLAPKQIGTDTTWSYIACGSYHTVALKKDGTLWAWGNNGYGQLGDGATDSKVPKQIGTDTTWTSIACGLYHTSALKKDGTLWAWGECVGLQLKSKPVKISTDVSLLSSSYTSIFFIKDISLYSLGDNRYGKLGFDHSYNIATSNPIDITYRTLTAVGGGIANESNFASNQVGKGKVASANGIQYHENKDGKMNFLIPLNLVQVSSDDNTYTSMTLSDVSSAKYVKVDVVSKLKNMLQSEDITLSSATIIVNGVKKSFNVTKSSKGVFVFDVELTQSDLIIVTVEVTLGEEFATLEGETAYVPNLVKVDETAFELFADVNQNILPDLNRYSPLVNNASTIVTATIMIDTSKTYTLKGNFNNVRVSVLTESGNVMMSKDITSETTVLELFNSIGNTVKGHRLVKLQFSPIDTQYGMYIPPVHGLYLSYQGDMKPRNYIANEVEIVIGDSEAGKVYLVDGNYNAFETDKFDVETKSITASALPDKENTLAGYGIQLSLKDAVGDLVLDDIVKSIDKFAFEFDVNITDDKGYKVVAYDGSTGKAAELAKIGNSYVLYTAENSIGQYIAEDGTMKVYVVSNQPVNGDEISMTIKSIRAYTAIADIGIHTRHIPVVYVNSNGDVRLSQSVFNPYGKASEMRFVRDELIKLEPVSNKDDLDVIFDSPNVLITDVDSTNVGLVDHPYNNPLGLFEGIDRSNLVGTVGFKEAEFLADSKFTNNLSSFELVNGALEGLSSQDTTTTLNSPAYAIVKTLVNTAEGLSMMLTLIPTTGEIDTFNEQAKRFIVPLNVVLPEGIETFEHKTIIKRKW